jgi:hypothetical protein
MKIEKKLHRVDIDLSYLVYTDEDYSKADVYDWIKLHFHTGELDDSCSINIVTDVNQINKDFNEDYCPYLTDDADEGTDLSDVINRLGLDAKKMIKRLESLGYKVTKK